MRNSLFSVNKAHQETGYGDFPGGPVANTRRSQQRGPDLIPDQRTRSHILQLRICTL